MKKLVVVALAAACGGGSSSGGDGSVTPPVDASTRYPEVALVTTSTNRKLDVLFVIDDSASTLDKQMNLRNNLPNIINELQAGPFPDLHIGVVSTDMGTTGEDSPTAGPSAGTGPGSCAAAGKDGQLTVNGSTAIVGNFIRDDGTTKNYTGTLLDRMSEIMNLGSAGCGFEQPLHAMVRALDPANTANADFLRSDARLGVVVLTDEDDCSMKDPTLLSSDTSTFGAFQSFRCTRFGVTCDTGGATSDAMNTAGDKSGCHSNESSPYVTDVGRYKTLLDGLKADPRAVMFASIAGDTTPFAVELRTPPGGGTQLPALAHSCSFVTLDGTTSVADPAVRIDELAHSVARGTTYPVCQVDLAPALTDIGVRASWLVGGSCLASAIAEPARCEAFDINAAGTMTQVPTCDANKTAPCFEIVENTACPYQAAAHVIHAGAVSDDTWTSVRCAP